MFQEREQVVLTENIGGDDGALLRSGDVGTVIHVHPQAGAYVVEFPARDGDAIAVATVLPSQARLAAGTDLLYAPRDTTLSSALHIPYVIDNQNHRMADVLGSILAGHAGKSMDVATAYFNVQGYSLLRQGLKGLGSFRLLLGEEPQDGGEVGLRPRAASHLIQELNGAPFDEATLRAVEDLIAFLRRDLVAVRAFQKGFLHAKSYIFYGDLPVGGDDRFQPIAAIVGSSNFTGPGLTTNKELNLSHKTAVTEQEIANLGSPIGNGTQDMEFRRTLMSSVGDQAITELDRWFRERWEESRDFKDEIIELLDSSKFGKFEYSPYQVYMKALFEYFKDDLDAIPPELGKSAVELSEFQEDAVKKARRILARYDGVLIGDSVGLGKTWIGKKLLEDYAYHMRQKALVVCPASLRHMWASELRNATIAGTIVSQEELGQSGFDPDGEGDADIILIDESHNFRTRTTNRYENLERIISANGGKGRAGNRKKLILLTATPINNTIFDLYNQITLITRGDRSYFSGAGIGDLHRFFLNARRQVADHETGVALFNLLEEVVIRRTRAFVRHTYPEAKINGETIQWPERQLKTVRYNLESTYSGIYDKVVAAIDGLKLAPYQLETYKKVGVERDEFEQGREEALAGIFRSRYLKRFESSVDAFRITVTRALEYTKTFESYLLDGKLLDSASFQKSVRYLSREDEDEDSTPGSRAEEMDASEEAREILDSLTPLDPSQYDLRTLHEALQHDVESLSQLWHSVEGITPAQDAKLQSLKSLLAEELKGQKVIVFTYYRDTARYLYGELAGERGTDFRASAGNPLIRRMDGGASPAERSRLIEAFAPISNNRPNQPGSDEEVDILLSTDVLSEGQNLQDCGVLVNYDLHWNPTRMVQRAGRIDRIGSKHPTLWVHNMFPEAGLERLLRLVESLNRKIIDIDRTGFLDASVLGETVHPRNFNTLRRIMDEDSSVIDEQEQFAELASNEFLLLQLRTLLEAGGREMLESLPDGIHSGLARQRERGMFFYFTAPRRDEVGHEHFWRYYDFNLDRVLDNRFLIANLIACSSDTPRLVGDSDVFAVQDKVMDDILSSVQERRAVEAAPRILDPLQQTVITLLRGYLNSPSTDRNAVRQAMRFLGSPMTHTAIRDLRRAHERYQQDQDIQLLVAQTQSDGAIETHNSSAVANAQSPLCRDDLRLVCFDFICS